MEILIHHVLGAFCISNKLPDASFADDLHSHGLSGSNVNIKLCLLICRWLKGGVICEQWNFLQGWWKWRSFTMRE